MSSIHSCHPGGDSTSGENHIITPAERAQITGRLLLVAHVEVHERKTERQVWVPDDGPLDIDRDRAEVEAAVACALDALA